MYKQNKSVTAYLPFLTFLLTLIGLLDALYLSIERFTPAPLPCLNGQASCELLQNSSYSVIVGIPVAYMGAVWYLTMTILAVIAIVHMHLRKKAYTGMTLGLIGAVPFEMYLIGVMVYLNLYCYWCIASAVIVFLLVPVVYFAKRFHY